VPGKCHVFETIVHNPGIANRHMKPIEYLTIQEMLDHFFQATSLGCFVYTYPDNLLLARTALPIICEAEHFSLSKGNECQKHHLALVKEVDAHNEAIIRKCPFQLYQAAAPVFSRQKKMATLIVGQVLFEKPDVNQFVEQAQSHGKNIGQYLKELSKISIIDQNQLTSMATFLARILTLIFEIRFAQHPSACCAGAAQMPGKSGPERKDLVIQELQAQLANKEKALDSLKRLNDEFISANRGLTALSRTIGNEKKRYEMALAQKLDDSILPRIREIKASFKDHVHKSQMDILAATLLNLMPERDENMDQLNRLTQTELRIATMIHEAMTSHEISKSLCISIDTVKTHRKNIRKKLHLKGSGMKLSNYLKKRNFFL
jgi:DNA-binding CsgD family transcriptional regulator/ligand-binding sensor protein